MISRDEVVRRIRKRIYEELGWDGTIISFIPPLHTGYRIGVMYFPGLVFEDYEFPLDTTADDMVASVMLSLTFR